MAYAQGAEYDFFVSYAHMDNEAVEPAGQGWVDALVRWIEVGLGMKLGRRDAARMWRDARSLRGNQGISGHIDEQVRRSALFVMVLSPSYLASDYCMAELAAFTERNAADRIFVVWKDPIDEARHPVPETVRNLRKYAFWVPDQNQKPRVLGWPLPRHDWPADKQLYFPKIDDLATDIVAALDAINAGPATTPAAPRRGAVLLAEVTDDLDPRREEMRRYLDQAGIDVLPAGAYRMTRQDFERGFAADLPRCRAFVQLLGPLAGKTPEDVPEGFGRLQLQLAQKGGAPVLQWRDPELDLAQVGPPVQRTLLQGDGVQAMPFEAFKRSVAALFEPPPPARRPAPPAFLFVNAADVDVAHAERLVAALDGAFDWELPVYDPAANAEEIQSGIEAQLLDSDALVFFYGEANPRWVRSQLQLYRKLAPRRAREPRMLALVSAPPEPKPPLQIGLQGLQHISLADAPARIRTMLGA